MRETTDEVGADFAVWWSSLPFLGLWKIGFIYGMEMDVPSPHLALAYLRKPLLVFSPIRSRPLQNRRRNKSLTEA